MSETFVSTQGEADALPIGSVIMPVTRRLGGPNVYYRVGPNGWTGDCYVGFAGSLRLPARVLYVPGTCSTGLD